MSEADNRLIVPLDFSSRAEAENLVETLGDAVSFYKIGYQLAYGGDGLDLGRELIAAGKQVFFDLKLLDISNTVAKVLKPLPKPEHPCSPFTPILRPWRGRFWPPRAAT